MAVAVDSLALVVPGARAAIGAGGSALRQPTRDGSAATTLPTSTTVVLDEIAGQTLRQCSPLGPALTPRERWTLLGEAERLIEAEERKASP